MKNVPKSGQPELIGSVIRRQPSPIPGASYMQLEMFNKRILRKLVVSDPGDSKGTTDGKRIRSAGASGTDA